MSAGAERRPIGFVADPKRLNVAISRAVAGLIVVGDLQTLTAHSSHWKQLVGMAKELGCATGEPLLDGHQPFAGLMPPNAETLVPPAEASAAWDTLTS